MHPVSFVHAPSGLFTRVSSAGKLFCNTCSATPAKLSAVACIAAPLSRELQPYTAPLHRVLIQKTKICQSCRNARAPFAGASAGTHTHTHTHIHTHTYTRRIYASRRAFGWMYMSTCLRGETSPLIDPDSGRTDCSFSLCPPLVPQYLCRREIMQSCCDDMVLPTLLTGRGQHPPCITDPC
jgi:hypothetical protein